MKSSILLLLIFILASCAKTKSILPASKPLTQHKVEDTTSIQFKIQETLSITGNFSGKEKDILTAAITDSLGNPLKIVPDPRNSDWDSVVRYYAKTGLYTTLTLKKEPALKLNLTGQGLYCLINIGDNNKDGKDEIAIVKDMPDYSNVNSCRIYSFCDGTWKELLEFAIYEEAFSFYGDTIPVFNTISEYLEFHNGQWMYRDYHEEGYDTPEEVGQMKKLIVPKCK